MDFDSIRPILSGLAGGAVAVWLGYKWRRFLPAADSPSTQLHLRDKYARTTRAANWLFGLAIAFALSLYMTGMAVNNEWYPLGLGFGGGSLAVLLLMAAAGRIVQDGKPADAFRAYALAQASPVAVLLPLLLLASCLFPWALYSALS